MAIYKAHQKKMVRPDLSFEKLMQDDYTYFKDHNYDLKSFDKVFTELKVKKP